MASLPRTATPRVPFLPSARPFLFAVALGDWHLLRLVLFGSGTVQDNLCDVHTQGKDVAGKGSLLFFWLDLEHFYTSCNREAYVVHNVLAIVDGGVSNNLQLDQPGRQVGAGDDVQLVNDGGHGEVVVSGLDLQVVDRGHSDDTFLLGGELESNIALSRD